MVPPAEIAALVTATSYSGYGQEAPPRTPWPLRPAGFLSLMALLQLVHMALRPVLTPVVGTDDVDQVFFSQYLAAGYSYETPPLYTWLMWLVTQLLGPTVLAVGIVKYSVVFSIHLFTYLGARRILADPRLQVVAGLAPMTLYPIGWRLHEADAYGVLSAACMMALVWAALALLQDRRLRHYLALGLALGAGLLSSGYFGIGAMALLLALPFVAEGRRALLHWGFPLALAVAALAVLPWALWILEQGQPFWDRARQVMTEGRSGDSLPAIWLRLWKVVESFVLAGFPFWVIFPTIFYYSLRPLPEAQRGPVGRLFWAYLALAGLGYFLAVALGPIPSINAFRMYPAVLPLVLLFFWRLERFGLQLRPMRWTWLVFAILIVVVIQARFQHIEAGPAFCKVCRMQAPYPDVAQLLRQEGYDGTGTIIAGDNYVAGNARVNFPEARIITPRYAEIVPPRPAGEVADGPCLVLWHDDMRDGDRKRFLRFVADAGIVLPPMEEIPLRIIEVRHTPRIAMPNRTIQMRFYLAPAPTPTCG